MLQWFEKDPVWHNEILPKSDCLFWPWLEGTLELSPEDVHKYAMCNLKIELDCERRSSRMITELNLPLDLETYIKKANAYVMFYHLLPRHRKWYIVGKEPYNIPEVWQKMPNNLYDLNYDAISDDLVSLYEKHMPYLLS